MKVYFKRGLYLVFRSNILNSEIYNKYLSKGLLSIVIYTK